MNSRFAVWMGASSCLFGLVSCDNDYAFSEDGATMAIAPEVADLGEVPVGFTDTVLVRLDNLEGGDIVIEAVELGTGDDGADYFSVATEAEVISEGESEYVTISYKPLTSGYHMTTLTVTSNAELPSMTIDVRGQGVEAGLVVTPPVLDYGALEVGESALETVHVDNEGTASIDLTSVRIDDSNFVSATILPVTLAPGDILDLDVQFTATTIDPVEALLELISQDVTVGTVLLRANDCEHGLPEAYDVDADGYTSCGGDCDDDDPTARPGGTEDWDGVDDDCDDIVDEGTEGYDDDGDGFAEVDGDCNDGDPWVNPEQPEDYSNGVDDDCDGTVDSGTTDIDGDGYSPDGDDCDDEDGTVYPGAEETPDGVDDDCDEIVDEGTTAFDDDGDTYTEDGGDCDDTNDTIYPGADELEDWADNDCDSTVDEGTNHYDDDGDGFTEDGGDCNDSDPEVSPAELETVGDGIDNDCDGDAD